MGGFFGVGIGIGIGIGKGGGMYVLCCAWLKDMFFGILSF